MPDRDANSGTNQWGVLVLVFFSSLCPREMSISHRAPGHGKGESTNAEPGENKEKFTFRVV